MIRIAAALLAVATAAMPAMATDDDELFGAAVTQWVQVNCEEADQLNKNMVVLAAAVVNKAPAEELRAARKRVRDEVAKVMDEGGTVEVFCSFILLQHTAK